MTELEFAKLCRVCRRTVLMWISKGLISAVKETGKPETKVKYGYAPFGGPTVTQWTETPVTWHITEEEAKRFLDEHGMSAMTQEEIPDE